MYPTALERHQVFFLPGLGDGTSLITKATQHWRKRGYEPEVIPVGWRDGSLDFTDKLRYLVDLVDVRAELGSVYLVGTSAGGSAAFNVFLERPDKILRVVNICGRLRRGAGGRRSLERMSSTSPAFKHSVEMFEDRMGGLTANQLLRMMTVRALFGDELVPTDTTVLPGAYNIAIPTGLHAFTIGTALTVFSKPVLDFLQHGRRVA